MGRTPTILTPPLPALFPDVGHTPVVLTPPDVGQVMLLLRRFVVAILAVALDSVPMMQVTSLTLLCHVPYLPTPRPLPFHAYLPTSRPLASRFASPTPLRHVPT